IETSCDDTSLALLSGSEEGKLSRLIAHLSFSQASLMKKWGGVIPEVAARNHLAKLSPLLSEIFNQSQINPKDLDAVAVTTHPGLLGPLLTGLNMAKTLCLMYKIPLFSINHLYAHLEAIHLSDNVDYPYIGVLVSGGHGLYALVKSPFEFHILGKTLDDAPGEAFDKGGKMLGLGYPAGHLIDQWAAQGDQSKYSFPVCLKNKPNFNLSFSGLKTSLRNFLERKKDFQSELADICAGYQKAIIDALEFKLSLIIKKYDNLPIVVGGGVACNSELRRRFLQVFRRTYFVKREFCTDNGAMIANYALRTWKNAISFPQCLKVDARSRFLEKSHDIYTCQ
ncbi:MAG: tRNA (adenosine(37)-N6)-threonylcarbamoyltransferase complex transferase subunit TsaD, partial [Halobacteriovoraceae bacterium]|nr:tRNA (adenosine(37)-N6)-threonylcarbamoyltransferase complex transferase subunit TsaD [Halobacteriovoraceae bacterium]